MAAIAAEVIAATDAMITIVIIIIPVRRAYHAAQQLLVTLQLIQIERVQALRCRHERNITLLVSVFN